MKKKIVIAAMLAILAAVPVFAATNDQAQPQNEWYNQMFNNHQQMMQQAVDNGTITADQAAKMNEHMQQMMQNGSMMNGRIMGNGGIAQLCGAVGTVNNNTK